MSFLDNRWVQAGIALVNAFTAGYALHGDKGEWWISALFACCMTYFALTPLPRTT